MRVLLKASKRSSASREIPLAHLEVVGLNDSFIDLLGEELVADFLPERRVALPDEAAFAGDGFDDALAFELRVGFGHGVAVDTQFFGERTDGRQRLTGRIAPAAAADFTWSTTCR